MSHSPADRLFPWAIRLSAACAVGILALVVAYVVREAAPALARPGLAALAAGRWEPAEGAYGLSPMLLGSLLVTAGAVALAAPAGVLAAVFSRWVAPRALARPFRGLVGLMAGVPSVVYGFFGLTAVVPLVARLRPPGASLLAAALVLAMMILPTVALLADRALAAVPAERLLAAAGLGLHRGAILRRVALPSARRGILAGVVLAAARAAGETMAVMMVAGNVPRVPGSPLDAVRTLTANIALEMSFATGRHRAALFASGLALVLAVGAMVALSALIRARAGGRRD